MQPEIPKPSRRAVLGLAAMSAALAACTTGDSASGPGPSGRWTRTADGRVVISDPGVFGYSVMMPAGWDVASAAPPGAAAVQVAPREGGVAVELGVARVVAGETPDKAALRLAQRVAPGSDPSRTPPAALAPIPLQSGGGRRAQVFSIPQRGSERVVVVALIAESGVWAYQLLFATSRAGYDRGMPLMRNLVASYRRSAS